MDHRMFPKMVLEQAEVDGAQNVERGPSIAP